MAIDSPNDRPSGAVWDLEVPMDPLQLLWRAATWEYDRASDRVYWLDSPLAVLNVDEETAHLLVQPIIVSLRHGTPWEHYDLERTVEDREGSMIDVRIQCRRLLDADGGAAGCVGVAVDVSEQRRAERALRGIIDRYRRLVELSPECVAVHQGGIIRYVNPAGVGMAGLDDANAIIGRQILDFIHPVSLEQTLERIAALTKPGMASEPTEAVLVRADGTPVVVESVSVRTEWDGEPAYQVILRDITDRRQAEAALRYQASLVEHVSDAIVATDLEGRVQSWNPAAEALYGWTAEEVLGRSLEAMWGEGALDPDGHPRPGEVEHRTADGRSLRMLVSVATVRDELGQDSGMVAMCTDLTERLEREAAEARFSAVVASLDEGVLVVDEDGTIVSVNASARSILGDWVREGLHVADFARHFPLLSEDGSPLDPDQHPLAVALRTGRTQRGVVVGIVADNWPRWLSASVQRLAHPTARGAGALVCSFSNITDRKRAEEQLNFQATHDALTRLPNRHLILSALDMALLGARADNVSVAVHLLDLDRFKAINDSLGHVAGDRVLSEIAGRLRSAVRPHDRLGRLAGDEFVVISPAVSTVAAARDIAQRLTEAVSVPVRLESGREIVMTASIGVTLADGRQGTAETVLSHADSAMYRAKQRGRARIEFFDDDLRSTVARRLAVEDALRRAVDTAAVGLHFQPVVAAADRRVVGAEALARWDDHALGTVHPSEFIPVAEDTGLMVPLGGHILLMACEEAARWNGGADEYLVSVNLSPRQLTDPGLVGTVAAALESTQVDPRRVWLEVTESVLVEEAPHVAAMLRDLQRLGVHLAIDDFGTGYSSLAYLKRLPVEALKVDRSFVEGLGTDPESDAIVEAIVSLGGSLNLVTVAEGVESEGQLQRLRDMGCDLVQGYLFGSPVAAAALDLCP